MITFIIQNSDFANYLNQWIEVICEVIVWMKIAIENHVSGQSNQGNRDTKLIVVQSTPAVILFKSLLWDVID